MLVRGRSRTALCLSLISFLFTPAIVKRQDETHASVSPVVSSSVVSGFSRTVVPLTCNRSLIDQQSDEMATIGQARALLTDRLRDLNLDAQELAERALARDPRNMMALSILARQYTVLGSDREAEDAWRRVLASGGVVVWTATLYDVDYKSYFLMSFGRDALRIYRMGQFTGAIDRRMGYAKFPEPEEVEFYRAAAGCPSPSVAPVATIRWADVSELRSGNWVLWFKLAAPVTITSDRGNRKSLREIKVNLHGETGEVKFLGERNPEFDPEWDDSSDEYTNVRGIGLGPWEYNRRLRDMVLRFAEPASHIKRTSAGRGAGW